MDRIAVVVVHELQQVQQQPLQKRLAVRRSIDRLSEAIYFYAPHPSDGAFELRQVGAQTRRLRLQPLVDRFDVSHRQHPARSKEFHASEQRILVIDDFLRGFRVFAERHRAVQLVVGREDLLDLAALLRFLVRQQVQQQIRRRQPPHLIVQQLDGDPRFLRQPAQRRRVYRGHRRQQRQLVVGHHRIHRLLLQNSERWPAGPSARPATVDQTT